MLTLLPQVPIPVHPVKLLLETIYVVLVLHRIYAVALPHVIQSLVVLQVEEVAVEEAVVLLECVVGDFMSATDSATQAASWALNPVARSSSVFVTRLVARSKGQSGVPFK